MYLLYSSLEYYLQVWIVIIKISQVLNPDGCYVIRTTHIKSLVSWYVYERLDGCILDRDDTCAKLFLHSYH